MKAEEVLIVLNFLDDVDLSKCEFGVITRKGEKTSAGFELGEVLILDKESGREPEWLPWGRKPGKWDVYCETFDTLEEARAARVRALSGGTS